MTKEPKGTGDQWKRSIVLSALAGRLMHSGLRRPVKIRKVMGGVFIGCTYITTAALHLIFKEAL